MEERGGRGGNSIFRIWEKGNVRIEVIKLFEGFWKSFGFRIGVLV